VSQKTGPLQLMT